MQFPTQAVTEIIVPNNVPFEPGYDVIGMGTQVTPAMLAAGYPAAILFYSSAYDPASIVPQIKYQFIADKLGSIVFGYGLVANASVSQDETIVAYEGHGFAGTAAQSQFDFITATSASITNESVESLVANTSFIYQGTELATLLSNLQAQVQPVSAPLGLVAFGILTGSPSFSTSSANRIPMFYIGANLSVNRTYRLKMSQMMLNASVVNASCTLAVTFTTDGTVPSVTPGGSTTQLQAIQWAIPTNYESCEYELNFQVPVAAQWNFLFVLDNTVQNHPPTLHIVSNGSVTVTIEDIGQLLPNTLHTVFVPPPPVPTQYYVTQTATATHAFLQNGSVANTNLEMYQGQSPYGPNGLQTSDAFFSGPGPNTLGYLHTTGATAGSIQYIKLAGLWRHWYYSGGGIMRVGFTDSVNGYSFLFDQNVGTAPSGFLLDFTGSAVQTSILAGHFVGFNFGGDVAVGQFCPPGNYNYYGYMDGAAQGNPPIFSAAWAI
jgi:hypothetical protein